MKKGITIKKENNMVYIEGGQFPVRRYLMEDYDLGNNLLSWENASYMYNETDEEEADDYLLNHALQENKKLCVSFLTSDIEAIVKHFEECTEYETFIRKTKNIKNDLVFVYRKGRLSDYFDMDLIEDIFCDKGIRASSLTLFEDVEISDLVTGKYKMGGVPYNLIMDTGNMSRDAVLTTYGPVALILSGLIFGYPIEIIEKAIKYTFPY